jgi:DNA-binding beta-propeller fold protein YncE
MKAIAYWPLVLLGLWAGMACKKEAPPPAVESARAPLDALQPPSEIVYAASNALRIVDTALGQVTASIPLERAVFALDTSLDGRTIYVAASEGVYEIDAATNAETLLTNVPASDVRVSESGATISVLQHEVIVHKNGTRDVEPFHLLVIDSKTHRALSDREVGPRVFFASPADEKRHGLVVDGDGRLRLWKDGAGEEKVIDVHALIPAAPSVEANRIRNGVAVHGDHAYVPLEGRPARVVDVDLLRGTASAIDLERPLALRGLAVTPDGKKLVVDAAREIVVVDLQKRAIQKALELPGAHTGLAISTGGEWAALAQTIDGTGGSVTLVRLDPLAIVERVHLDDISPWAIAIRRRPIP